MVSQGEWIYVLPFNLSCTDKPWGKGVQDCRYDLDDDAFKLFFDLKKPFYSPYYSKFSFHLPFPKVLHNFK